MISSRNNGLLILLDLLLVGYISWRVATVQPATAVPSAAPSLSANQTADTSLCGPAALRAVLADLGVSVPLDALVKMTGAAGRGTSMYDLAAAARNLGCRAVGMKLSYDNLARYRKPLLVHLVPDHFVAVDAVEGESVVYTDQVGTGQTMSVTRFRTLWDGYVLVVTR